MIDLSLKPKKTDEEPLGLIVLGLIPFAALFWALIEMGL